MTKPGTHDPVTEACCLAACQGLNVAYHHLSSQRQSRISVLKCRRDLFVGRASKHEDIRAGTVSSTFDLPLSRLYERPPLLPFHSPHQPHRASSGARTDPFAGSTPRRAPRTRAREDNGCRERQQQYLSRVSCMSGSDSLPAVSKLCSCQ